MELAIINGTYRDNSNGQKQNGMSGTKLAAIPANIAFPLQNGQFRLPNIVPTAMPGLMNASVLRNPVRFNSVDKNSVIHKYSHGISVRLKTVLGLFRSKNSVLSCLIVLHNV